MVKQGSYHGPLLKQTPVVLFYATSKGFDEANELISTDCGEKYTRNRQRAQLQMRA